ncbi:MAG: hypothetical protein Q9217_004434 [Psora testacea]
MADSNSHKRSTSATRKPPSRPSTPLRPSSRTSLRDSQSFTPGSHYGASTSNVAFPLESLEPAFAELSDSMADLEANFMHLQMMHESLARFNEGFAAFLYGLNMNAFCVDFPEAPVPESFKRAKADASHDHQVANTASSNPDMLGEETFLTTDTSFVDNPPSSKAPTKYATPAPAQRPGSGMKKQGGAELGRGGKAGVNGRGLGKPRGSGIARGKPRGGR